MSEKSNMHFTNAAVWSFDFSVCNEVSYTYQARENQKNRATHSHHLNYFAFQRSVSSAVQFLLRSLQVTPNRPTERMK